MAAPRIGVVDVEILAADGGSCLVVLRVPCAAGLTVAALGELARERAAAAGAPLPAGAPLRLTEGSSGALLFGADLVEDVVGGALVGGQAPRVRASCSGSAGLAVLSGGGDGGGGGAPAARASCAPLTLTAESVGGAPMRVALLQAEEGLAVPLFLSPEHHEDLLAFIAQPPSAVPQLLLVTGTIKSGKTALVMRVLPGLLAAQQQQQQQQQRATPAPARAPAVFALTFRQGEPAAGAAALLVDSLRDFAAGEGVALRRSAAEGEGWGLNCLTRTLEELARALWARGRVLWVLLDELGAPLVASTPAAASLFIETLKLTLAACCSCARFVATTGSGMVTLLEALRASSVNGFVLLAALAPISLGREPPPPVAAAMASRILAAYAPCWAAREEALQHFTPERLLAVLQRAAHGGITSPRPALLAYLVECLGHHYCRAAARKGTPAQALEAATRLVLVKLREESEVDAAVALGRLPPRACQLLCALAEEGGSSAAALPPRTLQQHCEGVAFLDTIVELLCEGGLPVRLMPPYAALLRSWVDGSGVLAIRCAPGGALTQLAPSVQQGPGAICREITHRL